MSADRAQITDLAEDEGNYPHLETTRAIIGAAYEVHRELGPGFLEKVYEGALAQELTSRGVPVRCQAEIRVRYKGQEVGVYYADLLVDDNVVCEIKAVESLGSAHEAQLLHYLKATGIKVGLLLNFGSQRVQVKRFARTR
jgi:GxxExxY protein